MNFAEGHEGDGKPKHPPFPSSGGGSRERESKPICQFMKVLKQRFSQWFNGRGPVRRRGTLWEDRFRSVLVEDGEALHAMAAYIDLNPVRAGIVDDPKDYRWCGYGEACAHQTLAGEGLLRAAQASDPTRD